MKGVVCNGLFGWAAWAARLWVQSPSGWASVTEPGQEGQRSRTARPGTTWDFGSQQPAQHRTARVGEELDSERPVEDVSWSTESCLRPAICSRPLFQASTSGFPDTTRAASQQQQHGGASQHANQPWQA